MMSHIELDVSSFDGDDNNFHDYILIVGVWRKRKLKRKKKISIDISRWKIKCVWIYEYTDVCVIMSYLMWKKNKFTRLIFIWIEHWCSERKIYLQIFLSILMTVVIFL